MLQLSLSGNRLIIAVAVFLAAFANQAFFVQAYRAYADAPWAAGHLLSLAALLVSVLVAVLALSCVGRLTKPLLVTLLLVSSVTAYFMDTYQVIIDRDMLVNAVSTNTAEAADLLTLRLLAYVILLGILPSLFVVRVTRRVQPIAVAVRQRALLLLVAILAAAMLVLASSSFYAGFFREHKVLRYYTNPLAPLQGLVQFARARDSGPRPLVTVGEDAAIPASDVDRELVIMVVGETARADHFALNGYPRDTNPKLAARDVVSFRRVASCGTSTAISVPCMFALQDRSAFDDSESGHIENALDVLQRAGVQVLWRDNNSSSKGVADRVAYEDYRSAKTNPVCDGECRDEGMLQGLQDYIDRQPGGDILIVLHQMGSHGPAYYKRYPAAFAHFQPTCDTNRLDNCGVEEITNSYDNTIRYTDHFLDGVIALLQANDARFETALLYVSDHGESLGESGLYLHGLPYVVAPQAQTHVAMLMWLGRNFHATDRVGLGGLADTPLSHDHVFHTLLGLFEVDSGVYSADRDLLQLSRQVNAGTPRP